MPDPAVGSPRPISFLRPLLIGAAVLTVLSAGQHWTIMQLEAERPEWRTVGHALAREAPIWFLWVLAAPLILWAVRRFPLVQGRLATRIPLHVGFALLVIAVHQFIVLAGQRLLGYPVGSGPLLERFIQNFPFRLPVGFSGYGLVLGTVLALEYYRRFRERELAAVQLARQLAEARLQALRMQLNPHFLFNAMNSIAMLVRQKSDGEAVRMLAGLSEILRHVLLESPAPETTLEDELAFIERYLAIEQARFGDRLRISVDVPEALRGALVPTLILQPLVENAVRHGIARRAAPGTISITARRTDAGLTIAVVDDGPGRSDTPVTPATGIPLGTGIGLANTRSRLTQLYGAEGRCELISSAASTEARLSLPWRVASTALELEEVGT